MERLGLGAAGCNVEYVPVQVLRKKKASNAAAKRAIDGLVAFLCGVDVRLLMAADQAMRETIFTWLKSLNNINPNNTMSVQRVLSALEQAVCQHEPKLAPKAAAVKLEPPANAEASPKLEEPPDAAVAFLKDGRISQSTLAMFDLSSVLQDDKASAMLLDDSKLAHMSSDKVHTHTPLLSF